MDPTTESQKPILTFDEEFGVPAATTARNMLEGPDQFAALPAASQPEVQPLVEAGPLSEKLKRMGEKAVTAALITGGLTGIYLTIQAVGNAVESAVNSAQISDFYMKDDQITAAIKDASESPMDGTQPIAMFTIDADTPYISTGVDEFKKDPTSAYADVNASERGFDARALNDSALNLNIKDASQVGDTYGIFNDKDLDGDKDDDLYVKKITP